MTILRWSKKFTMLESLTNLKRALRAYMEDPEAKFLP